MADRDIFLNYNFAVECGPGRFAYFMKVEGLSVVMSKIAYRESGSQGGGVAPVRKLPGRAQYGDVTLLQGATADLEIWNWLMNVVNGNCERRTVSISVRPPNGGTPEQTRWNLFEAWPCEWELYPLDALGQGPLIAKLVLTHEGLTRT